MAVRGVTGRGVAGRGVAHLFLCSSLWLDMALILAPVYSPSMASCAAVCAVCVPTSAMSMSARPGKKQYKCYPPEEATPQGRNHAPTG